MILLDTSFLIELLSKREAAVIKAREIDAQPKAISSITLYELFIGAQQQKRYATDAPSLELWSVQHRTNGASNPELVSHQRRLTLLQ